MALTFKVGKDARREPRSILIQGGFRRTPSPAAPPAAAMQSSFFELRPAKTVDHQKGDEAAGIGSAETAVPCQHASNTATVRVS
jgi:hypothetical protein